MPKQWPHTYPYPGGGINAALPSAGLAIESTMESLLLKGLTKAFLTEFNALHHASTRLNSLLPSHAQLGGLLVAKKLCAVVRRISESIKTTLDVKLVIKGRPYVAKQLGRPEPATLATPPRNRGKLGDPPRHARDPFREAGLASEDLGSRARLG
eukprot:5182345-Pleurochrysis_carterae.AAC.7